MSKYINLDDFLNFLRREADFQKEIGLSLDYVITNRAINRVIQFTESQECFILDDINKEEI